MKGFVNFYFFLLLFITFRLAYIFLIIKSFVNYGCCHNVVSYLGKGNDIKCKRRFKIGKTIHIEQYEKFYQFIKRKFKYIQTCIKSGTRWWVIAYARERYTRLQRCYESKPHFLYNIYSCVSCKDEDYYFFASCCINATPYFLCREFNG